MIKFLGATLFYDNSEVSWITLWPDDAQPIAASFATLIMTTPLISLPQFSFPDDEDNNGMALKTKIGMAMIMILMALLMTG